MVQDSSDEDKEFDLDRALKEDKINEDNLREAGLDYEEAENLGTGGLADLKKEHKKKKSKKLKKEKKNKKEKKSKKSKKKNRLKRMHRDSDAGEGDLDDVFGDQGEDPGEYVDEGNEKREKFADE